MTPAAHLAAAIDILDRINAGTPAEVALTGWARGSRYAGSGDWAAVRDLVFDALRRRRSAAAMGGGTTGRALVIGLLRNRGVEPGDLFGAGPHAPPPLSEGEARAPVDLASLPRAVRLDYPDWLEEALARSLGGDLAPVMARMRERAPVFLRANLRKTTREGAIETLGRESIKARPHPLCETAIEVTLNARRIRGAQAWRKGLVELQDAASQAVVAELPLPGEGRILDYCAGGGGKALAMAAPSGAGITAHDAHPRRMKDLPVRAERAGVVITIAETDALAARAPFDLVLCDMPCSGSGSWRRDPAGKWALNAEKLRQLKALQRDILARAAPLVAPGGALAYATCSLLAEENEGQVDIFLQQNPAFRRERQRRFSVLEGGDGMFVAVLRRQW